MMFSNKGLQLLKQAEGFSAVPYKDSGGVLTIGYGTTDFPKDMESITEAQAEILLRRDVAWAERTVQQSVTTPLTQNQFDALVIFVYNIGRNAFLESTMLKRLNDTNVSKEERLEMASREFMRWVFVKGKIIDGLINRRKMERELFQEA